MVEVTQSPGSTPIQDERWRKFQNSRLRLIPWTSDACVVRGDGLGCRLFIVELGTIDTKASIDAVR
jgi:hypothetical protein